MAENNKKVIIVETLAQFAASFKAKIDILLNNKVDKVNGKGLSTNDFNNTYKQKLEALQNPKIQSLKLNGVELTPDEAKSINFDLSTYAIKTEVTQEIAEAVSGINGFEAQIVETLPETGDKGVLYLVANQGADGNEYNEYVWISSANKYEKLGSRELDLSQYAKKTDLPTKLSQLTNDSGYQTSQNVSAAISNSLTSYTTEVVSGLMNNKVDKVEGMGLSANNFTDEYETKLNDLQNYTPDFATTADVDTIITEVFGNA